MVSKLAKQLVGVLKETDDEGEAVKEFLEEIKEEGEKPKIVISVQISGSNGITPLHAAAYLFDNPVVLEMLIATGIDVNETMVRDGRIYNLDGKMCQIREFSTPLLLAAKKGHKGNVTALLKHGANPNSLDADNNASLLFAVRGHHVDMAKSLIEKGADVDVKNNKQVSALHIACRRHGQQVSMLKLLLESKACPDFPDEEGNTPLHIAVSRGKIESVKLLLRYCDVNRTNNEGMTAMHIACMKDLRETAKILLRSKADLMIRDEEEKKALDYATPHMRQVLLEYSYLPEGTDYLLEKSDEMTEIGENDERSLKDVEEANTPVPADVQELRARSMTLHQEHQELKIRHDELNSDHTRLKKDNEQLLTRISDLEARQERLELAIGNLMETYDSALSKTVHMESKTGELEDKLERVSSARRRPGSSRPRHSGGDSEEEEEEEENDDEEDEDEEEDD
ncbi:ankyrin-1 [Lingula anatina]|uniref:Ankyrin-1 n=1 Tax=Lingula anatina TaxID=7574 RepID=A0A1S3H287_LINAN|nr:ankyrin-1 [Lingula anatina]|eukprot:XP_013380128.1 ankyrin-1 [Lingula anatina]